MTISRSAPPEKPTISVVVLNYNGLHHLEDCFVSLMHLEYPVDKLELILVDNGSKADPTPFIERRFPRVKVLVNSRNLGFAEGSNVGARAAAGRYVAFLNNDTRVHPEWLTHLVTSVSRSPDVVCAGSRILNWEGDRVDFIGGELAFYGHGFQEAFGSPETDSCRKEREVLFACGGAMLIERQVFLDAGGFDPDYFAFFEDIDLGWRLWVLGHRVVLQPASVVYHKHHGTAGKLPAEWKYVMYERNALYTIIKNYDQANLDKVLPAALLLSAKRGLSLGRVDKRKYYLDSEILGGAAADRGSMGTETAGPSPLARLGNSLREVGFVETCRRFVLLVAAFTERLPHYGVDHITKPGMSHFIAMDDVLVNMQKTLEKRTAIQAARRRDDAEIFRLFKGPFRSNCAGAGYDEALSDVSRLFGIDEMFGAADE